MASERREYTAGRPTTLTAALSIGATAFTIADATNWPTSVNHDFWVTVDGGTAQEERILCSARTGTSVTVRTRGADGTTESNHSAGATIWPSWSATDADEANEHINAVTNVHGITGAIAPLNSPTFTGTVVLPSATSIGNVSSTEIGYLDGVTSAVQTQIGTVTAGLPPVGSITMWPKNEIPTGWLECNGQSTTGYTALAAIVGATVPDMQGLVPVGFKTSDADFGTLKGTGGWKASQTHTHTNEAAGYHAHGGAHLGGASYRIYGATYGADGAHGHGINTAIEIAGSLSNADSINWLMNAKTTDRVYVNTDSGGSHQHSTYVDFNADGSHTHTINSFGTGASATNTNGNLQPYFTLKFIIKT
jgi:hypothetical protein